MNRSFKIFSMQQFFCFFLLLLPISFFSQTKEITKILNAELEKEIQHQFDTILADDSYFVRIADTLTVMQYFEIKDGILSLVVKKPFYYGGGYQIEKQAVRLSDIVSVGKDIQVIFDSDHAAVQVSRTHYYDDGRVETTSQFETYLATYLSFAKQNEYLADALIAAFRKAGFKIEKNSWYD